MNQEETHQQLQEYIIRTIENQDPTRVLLAEVVQVHPIELVLVHTNIRIYSSQIVLTKNVMNYEVQITYDYETESAGLHTHEATGVVISPNGSHNHTLKGTSRFLIHNELHLQDYVTVVQYQNADKYVILDKYYENEKYESINHL